MKIKVLVALVVAVAAHICFAQSGAKPVVEGKVEVITLSVVLSSDEVFDVNRSILKPAAKEKIDKEILLPLKSWKKIELINITGHTDNLGSRIFNQSLSLRRANSVKAYLVSKGIGTDVITTSGAASSAPVKKCKDSKDRVALVQCLAPNRRVVIEARGSK